MLKALLSALTVAGCMCSAVASEEDAPKPAGVKSLADQIAAMKKAHQDREKRRQSSSGTVAWYLADQLGSVRGIVNNSGSTIATLTYDSFGNLTSAEDSDADRFRFTGREWS